MAVTKEVKAALKRPARLLTKRRSQSLLSPSAEKNTSVKPTYRLVRLISFRGRTRIFSPKRERVSLLSDSSSNLAVFSDEIVSLARTSNVTALRPGMSTITLEVEVEQGQEATFTDFINRILPIAALVQHEKTDAQLRKLSEALLPDIALPDYKIIEAAMQSKAKAEVLNSGDFITAAELCRLAGFSQTNPSAQPNRWKNMGQVFAIRNGRQDYYPFYAFDLQPTLRPKPIMKEIIAALEMDDWHLAYWFMSGCSMLDGQLPKDLLGSNPDAVLAAAVDQAVGIMHG
jgi:hypothetical protein